jgi:LysR family glycine cleavage system transcriptional activator
MENPGFRLPPLPAIRVFEAVARHLSFTKAAVELGVTQAAVSYQIKLLEDRVGTVLFRRLPRKLALTDAGQRLASPVNDALGRLAEAFAAVQTEENSALRITAIHTFATNWLVPRLGRFTQAHPHYSVHLDTSPRAIDLVVEQIDIGIRSGRGQWPGLAAESLIPISLTPMVSPTLLASIGGAKSPLDLLKLPLLREDDNAWEEWFALSGHVVPPGIARGPLLDTRQIMGRAAIEGQGVALLVPEFFTSEIADGRLVQPFPQQLFSPQHYYLAYAKSRQHVPKIRAFRSWILGELAADARSTDRSQTPRAPQRGA